MDEPVEPVDPVEPVAPAAVPGRAAGPEGDAPGAPREVGARRPRLGRRAADRLVGAGVTLLVLVLLAVALLWSVSAPAGTAADGAIAASPPPPGTGGEPPVDLEAGEIWSTGLVLDAATVATPDGALHDVAAVGQDVRTGPDGLVAGALNIDATVPFDLVASQIADDVVVGPGPDGLASVTRTVTVAGREVTVVATGTVGVEDGLLVVEPQTIDVGGPAFLSTLLGSLARRLVTIEHEIEGLPEGLVLRDVAVQPDGFRASLTGEDVRLAAQGG